MGGAVTLWKGDFVMKKLSRFLTIALATGCSDLTVGLSRDSESAKATARPLACATSDEVAAFIARIDGLRSAAQTELQSNIG